MRSSKPTIKSIKAVIRMLRVSNAFLGFFFC